MIVNIISVFLLLIGFQASGLLLMYHIIGYKLISYAANPTLEPLKNVVQSGAGYWIQTYDKYPWKYLAPVVAYAGIIESLWAAYYGWVTTAFWASCFAVGGIVGTAGATLFPFLMPSSTNPNESLTVWNAASSQYALNMMLYVGVVLLFIILGYKIFAYSTIWGKKPTLTAEDIKKDEHSFY